VVQDTLVGLLGAVLIVGSMVTAINLQETAPAGEAEDAPAPIGKSVWRASGCEAGSLFWTPSLEDLDEVVGERLDPAEGPVPDNGLFWLFVYSCESSTVDGLSVPPQSGAAALALVEEPDDTHNVSAPDGWTAVPTWYGSSDSRVSEIFEKHEFELVPAQASLGTTSTPLNDQVRLSIDAPEGRLTADMTVSGEASEREVEGAMVGTDEETFSVFHGPESMQRSEDGSARVETQGTTWVERLNLEPSPYSIAYDQDMSWNFTFEHEPWDAEANATDGGNASMDAGVGQASGLRGSWIDLVR
jgi:hypothetical protein